MTVVSDTCSHYHNIASGTTVVDLHLDDSDTVEDSHTAASVPLPAFSPIMAAKNLADYQQAPITSSNGVVSDVGNALLDDVTSFYEHQQPREDADDSSQSQHQMQLAADSPDVSHAGFSYSSYAEQQPVDSDQTYMPMSSSYMEAPLPVPRPGLVDSYPMSLPPYLPSSDVNRLHSYLPPYGPHASIEMPRSTESSPVIYGRFTKDLFSQYLHDTAAPAGPLHPLATHSSLHDQHAGILGPYQQSSALPIMPHSGGGGSELYRRACSSVGDNLFRGMKSPSQATMGVASTQVQHWTDSTRGWNPSPPMMHAADVSPHYNYPLGRTDDTAKSLAPIMSKRMDEMPTMFATSACSASSYGPLSGSVYSPASAGPSPYRHPVLPSSVTSSQRHLEDAYKQMAAASGDYRHHRTASEMYGSALSSLDRYYYSARDAMYRAAAMPHAFISQQTSISPHYSSPVVERGEGGSYVSTYGQCPPGPAPPYGFICHDKQYLPSAASDAVLPAVRPAMDYLDSTTTGSQPTPGDSYSRHSASVIYQMMPRYF